MNISWRVHFRMLAWLQSVSLPFLCHYLPLHSTLSHWFGMNRKQTCRNARKMGQLCNTRIKYALFLNGKRTDSETGNAVKRIYLRAVLQTIARSHSASLRTRPKWLTWPDTHWSTPVSVFEPSPPASPAARDDTAAHSIACSNVLQKKMLSLP